MSLQPQDARSGNVPSRRPAQIPRWSRTVHHGGRHYVATTEMAAIFEAHATAAIASGSTELVPLLHRGGVDLLLITPTTSIAVVNIEVGLRPVP
ncbi:MAG: hypothetical protein JWO10_39 [Microbacteriaceae bacterium]|nr:hypothetical protein [Microbacteriaceae bacterium]